MIRLKLSPVLDLPFSTAACDVGPVMEYRPGQATLSYDAEDNAGTVWISLRFYNSIAAVFTPDPACVDWMLDAYSRVSEVTRSAWKSDLTARASVQEMALPATVRHFVIYFDHVGCWEVLADAVALVDGGQPRMFAERVP